MYSAQVTHLTTHDKQAIEIAIARILNQAKGLPCHENAPPYLDCPFELSFMLFPLFLAGVMTTSLEEKSWILEYLSAQENEYLGRNVRSVKNLLQSIYLHQNKPKTAAMMGFFSETDFNGEDFWKGVDWKTFMKRPEYQVMCFAL